MAGQLTGVGIGYREKDGQLTDELTRVYYVPEKLPLDAIPPGEIIPSRLPDGTPTDVQAAIFEAQALWIGDAIAATGLNGYGTAGAIFRHYGRDLLLTNEHVVRKDSQPAIGQGYRWADPFKGYADAALIQLIPETLGQDGQFDYSVLCMSSRHVHTLTPKPHRHKAYSSDIRRVRRYIKGIASAKLGQIVWKVGATTGYTEGVIATAGATVAVSFGDRGNATLYNQTLIRRGPSGDDVSRPGDSGSCWYDGLDRAVALLFAGTQGDLAIATPIQQVLMELFSLTELEGWNIDQSRGHLRQDQVYNSQYRKGPAEGFSLDYPAQIWPELAKNQAAVSGKNGLNWPK